MVVLLLAVLNKQYSLDLYTESAFSKWQNTKHLRHVSGSDYESAKHIVPLTNNNVQCSPWFFTWLKFLLNQVWRYTNTTKDHRTNMRGQQEFASFHSCTPSIFWRPWNSVQKKLWIRQMLVREINLKCNQFKNGGRTKNNNRNMGTG